MAKFRSIRVGDEIKTRLGEILPTLKDPRLQGIISITRVKVSNDSKYARVYVSALGDEAHLNDVIKGFRSSTGFIRRELAAAMQLRHTPELNFVADRGLVRGQHTIELLHDIEKADAARTPESSSAESEGESNDDRQ